MGFPLAWQEAVASMIFSDMSLKSLLSGACGLLKQQMTRHFLPPGCVLGSYLSHHSDVCLKEKAMSIAGAMWFCYICHHVSAYKYSPQSLCI